MRLRLLALLEMTEGKQKNLSMQHGSILTSYSITMILHPKLVIKCIYWRCYADLKSAILNSPLRALVRLIYPPRANQFSGQNVVNEESVVDRHLRICRVLKQEIENLNFSQKIASCEIGAGDCYASSDLLLGLGFERVYVVEKPSRKMNAAQIDILRKVAEDPNLPNKLEILSGKENQLNSERVIVVEKYFEETELPELIDLVLSFDVLEHVEDLPLFFKKCHGSLRKGGMMIHKFDLSGHGPLEDPMPPLDFQTYPDWLYNLMFPKYSRATRNLIDSFTKEIIKQGFKNIQVTPILKADSDYVTRIWPSLRKNARRITPDEFSYLDVVITASK